MTQLRDFLKATLRSIAAISPKLARMLLRGFQWNSDYYLRAALLMNIKNHLSSVVSIGPLNGAHFEDLLYEEIDPILRNQMEPILSALLLELDLSGKAVLDIGASYGYYTVLLSRCVGAKGIVYAFEPDVQSLLRLAHNTEINQINNAIILPYALSREVHTDVWSVDLLQPWNNRILVKRDETIAGTTIERPILSIPLNLLLETLPQAQIGLIKIDVEGAEVDVICGASELFKRVRPLAVIELHSKALADQTFELLSGYGYLWQTIEFKGDNRHHVLAFPQEIRDKYDPVLRRFDAE